MLALGTQEGSDLWNRRCRFCTVRLWFFRVSGKKVLRPSLAGQAQQQDQESAEIGQHPRTIEWRSGALELLLLPEITALTVRNRTRCGHETNAFPERRSSAVITTTKCRPQGAGINETSPLRSKPLNERYGLISSTSLETGPQYRIFFASLPAFIASLYSR